MQFENDIDDQSISWDCIALVILRIRGKSVAIKNEEYEKLNDGQKAIFSFHVYYDHAKNDAESFIRWSRYYFQMRFFGQIKKGGEYFGNDEYVELISKIERAITSEEKSEIEKVYSDFVRIGEGHRKWMGRVIRENRECFYSYK